LADWVVCAKGNGSERVVKRRLEPGCKAGIAVALKDRLLVFAFLRFGTMRRDLGWNDKCQKRGGRMKKTRKMAMGWMKKKR
jgi:hypothetical protein